VTVLPPELRVELDRLGERWRQLPLTQAVSSSSGVRALAQALADEVADAESMPRALLPDLGPAVALDELRVTVWDAVQAGVLDGLVERLAVLRRYLAG
jgi:hypothetical protein